MLDAPPRDALDDIFRPATGREFGGNFEGYDVAVISTEVVCHLHRESFRIALASIPSGRNCVRKRTIVRVERRLERNGLLEKGMLLSYGPALRKGDLLHDPIPVGTLFQVGRRLQQAFRFRHPLVKYFPTAITTRVRRAGSARCPSQVSIELSLCDAC